MKLCANKFMNVCPPVWRGRILELSLFAGFMTLAAWVLYLQGMNNASLAMNCGLRCAREFTVSAIHGMSTDRNGDPLENSAQFVSIPATHPRQEGVASSNLRMRASPVARVRVVPPPPALSNI
jgi:hypothetical protein